MDEYIEREAVYEDFEKRNSENPKWTPGRVKVLIARQKTADVAPVVHGRWEWFDEETGTPSTGYEREWGWRCSHCKEELPDDYDDPDDRPAFRFCYNCGAKMDGGADNEA